jgi:protein-ribulosamine 3-kinase
MPDWSAIYQHLDDKGVRLAVDRVPVPVSGGDISAAWRLVTDNDDLFIKTGPLSAAQMFAAEAEGLSEISQTNTIHVPQLVASGQAGTAVFLALEWLDLEYADEAVESRFGEQLAELHHVTRKRYGWHRNNTIGLTPQHNTWSDDWIGFFREHRLAFQLRLAAENGFTGELQRRGAQLLKRLPIYFEAVTPAASLLHGDLWGGNWGCSAGDPVIFDPAVYYGDRETDLAMSRLFGGFGAAFYEAYESSWPLADGHQERQHLYQLYHVLNHLNLFGSGYLGRAISLIDELL